MGNSFPDRTTPYSDPIGSNTEFYQILQEFDGSDEILVTESHWIPTVSDPSSDPKHGFPGFSKVGSGKIRSDPASDLLT
ncbi:unnamed protein product [Adineta ricciae]|uniref:Uncharacterized protein n=1 Tax=Adineta ricciae TaxID=249248 RepID=A0A814FVR5_ADIRI|nr:unnamed protein product [Adineta ricciae]